MHGSGTANDYPWINPVGGMGDALMLSGVLKMVHDRDPQRRYNLVRRTAYQDILENHPAIAEIGYLPKDAEMTHMTYWSMGQLGPGEQRPFQILARAFGLTTPVEEKLFLPGDIPDDRELFDFLPWGKRNVVICPTSASPRKEVPAAHWTELVQRLADDNVLVLQVGRDGETRVRGAYSLLGLTKPRELVALLRRADAVVTCDNFIMHAAHLTGTPAVVAWGPTDHEVYGYPEQMHLQPPRDCPERDMCIGPARGHEAYASPCPRERQCTAEISADSLYTEARKLLDSRM